MGAVTPIGFEGLTPELREMLGPRVERLGYLGEFFQYGAHQPDALAGFVRFSEALKEALPWELVEVVALTIAAETGNAYERVQHERLARRLGMSARQIDAILDGHLDSSEFSAAQVSAAELARCSARSAGRDCAPRLAALSRLVDEATAIGVLLLCSRYVAHAAVANTLGLEPPVVPTPGEGAMDGAPAARSARDPRGEPEEADRAG